jgi:hypothetical protein
VSLSQLVLDSLLILILLKLTGLALSGIAVLRLGASHKFTQFWNEYWDWKYLRDNTLNLCVWLVTLTGYFYCYRMLHGVHGHPIKTSFSQHPYVVSFVIGALVWFLISTTLQTFYNVKRTVELCHRISHPSLIKKVGKLAVVLSLFYLEASSLPFFLVSLAGITIPNLIINRMMEKKLTVAVEQFILLAIIEYAFRASVVVAGLYVETGHIRLW